MMQTFLKYIFSLDIFSTLPLLLVRVAFVGQKIFNHIFQSGSMKYESSLKVEACIKKL